MRKPSTIYLKIEKSMIADPELTLKELYEIYPEIKPNTVKTCFYKWKKKFGIVTSSKGDVVKTHVLDDLSKQEHKAEKVITQEKEVIEEEIVILEKKDLIHDKLKYHFSADSVSIEEAIELLTSLSNMLGDKAVCSIAVEPAYQTSDSDDEDVMNII